MTSFMVGITTYSSRLSLNSNFLYSSPSTDPEHTRHYYDFCEGLCSILFVHTHDPHDYHINQYDYVLMDGACKDTMSLSEEDWERLSDWHHFPQKIVQDYYDCLPDVQNSILNAIGVALGTIELFVFVTYFSFLIFFKKSSKKLEVMRKARQEEYEKYIIRNVLKVQAESLHPSDELEIRKRVDDLGLTRRSARKSFVLWTEPQNNLVFEDFDGESLGEKDDSARGSGRRGGMSGSNNSSVAAVVGT